MAKKTYLQLVNKVLTRLRAGTVSSISETDYSALIGEFVNDAKRIVEDAWDWTRLDTTINVTTSAGTTTYSITGAGERFRLKDDVIWNDTEECYLRPKPIRWIRMMNRDSDVTQNEPSFYAFTGVDSSGDPQIEIYPPPDATYTFNVDLIVPQDDLSAAADELNTPWYPVYKIAYAMAISERGEDGGARWDENDDGAMKALDDAIAQDAALQRDQLIMRVE